MKLPFCGTKWLILCKFILFQLLQITQRFIPIFKKLRLMILFKDKCILSYVLIASDRYCGNFLSLCNIPKNTG